MLTIGLVCLAPMFVFAIPASRSTMDYDSRITVNLEIKKTGDSATTVKEITCEDSKTLSARKHIDNVTESNIMITKAIDEARSYLLEKIK